MNLTHLTRPMSFERQRASSWNRTGANKDHVVIEPKGVHTIAELTGPGIVKHLWFTARSDDYHYLQRMRLRFTWDDGQTPAVDVPFGSFFCCGFDRVCDVETPVIAVRRSRAGNKDNPDPGRGGFNSFFPMPFQRRARLEFVNHCEEDTMLFYYVDWEQHEKLPAEVMTFHATFREQTTAPAGSKDDARTNLTGRDNYVILDVPRGAGTYVGCNMSVESEPERPGKWYEGDDMIFVDDRAWPPRLHGTGTEDFFCHAWGAHRPISSAQFGISHYERDITDKDRFYDGRFTLYRLHLNGTGSLRPARLVTSFILSSTAGWSI